MYDVLIIGAGAIGSFIARSLSRYDLKILIIEKETDVGDATSMANSAIAHSGYDPEPGTKKAYFNVLGNKMMPEVCKDLSVPYGRIGTLTVAVYDSQMPMLKELADRADKNGVEARILSADELRKMEPRINPEAKGALYCPTGGILNPFALTAHAMENACDNGAELLLGEQVLAIEWENGRYSVKTDRGVHEAKIIINAAGLHSDEIASMIEPITWRILPRKGEYFVLHHYAAGLVRHVLFPLPSDKGKGVLVSVTTSGNYIVGPSSEPIDDKDDVSTDAPTLENVKAQARILVPSIPFDEQIRIFSGVRATPSTHDFIIEPSHSRKDFINVAGIESPGLVSSPAIGEYVAKELVGALLPLHEKTSYRKKVRPYVNPQALSLEERNDLIRKNPSYGQIVCDCEKVSLGEIEDVLSRSVPCRTVKAVKKRTRAGFGKCQGGFCQPQVVDLLAKKLGLSPTEVLYDRKGSEIVKEEIRKKERAK